MRVTNDTLRQAFLTSLQNTQQQLKDTQNQLASGRRVLRPSDDPLAAARIQALEASVATLGQYQRNAGLLGNRLGLEEQVLASSGNLLQRARELAVQGNNATQSDETRAAIAIELREALSNLVDLANSKDAAGRYLFGGFRQDTQPFARSGDQVTYQGDQGQRQLQLGESRFIADVESGLEIFGLIKNGNGSFSLSADSANTGTGILGAGTVVDRSAFVVDSYSINFITATDYEVRDSGGALVSAGAYAPGDVIAFAGAQVEVEGAPDAGDSFSVNPSVNQDVFATIQNLITALETPAEGPSQRAQLNTAVGQSLVDLDQALGNIVDIRADVGARLRGIDEQVAANEGFGLQLSQTLSDIRDLDYAEAISRLTQQSFGLEIAQQTFVRIQGLSLFRFL